MASMTSPTFTFLRHCSWYPLKLRRPRSQADLIFSVPPWCSIEATARLCVQTVSQTVCQPSAAGNLRHIYGGNLLLDVHLIMNHFASVIVWESVVGCTFMHGSYCFRYCLLWDPNLCCQVVIHKFKQFKVNQHFEHVMTSEFKVWLLAWLDWSGIWKYFTYNSPTIVK